MTKYDIVLNDKGTVITLKGNVTLKGALDSHFKNFNRPDHDDLSYLILDALQVTHIHSDVVMAMSKFEKLQPLYKKAQKISMVTDNPKQKAAFLAYAENYGNPLWQYRVFETLQEALNWSEEARS